MKQEMRKTGISAVGDISWGTHFCAFYQTEQDQLDILLPYFKKGLESNEYCMWVTCNPLNSKKAELALEKVTGNLEQYKTKGQLEMFDYSQWYAPSGQFDAQKVLDGFVQKEKYALEKGFEGIRVAGNTSWIESMDWKKIVEYESAVNNVIGKHKIIALCAYDMGKCDTPEVLDVVSNHQFSLIRHGGEWAVVENARQKLFESEANQKEEKTRTIIHAMSDLIFILDENDRFSGYHSSKNNILYRPPEEFLGKKHNDLMPPQLCPQYNEASKKVRNTGKNAKYEYNLDINGKKHWFSVSLDLHPDRKSIVAVVRDITDSKCTEDKNKALEERFHQSQKNEMHEKGLEYDTLVGREFSGLVGNSLFIRETRKKIVAIGHLEIPVLIQGESGTGKEVVANCIHKYSLRAAKPFVVVNCTSLAPNLIESELFGHVQGAFTGAMKLKIGLFESADEGTLFLDEIGDLALDSQVKFLQVLDKGEFKRVGGTSTQKANVRLICATNQDLEKMVAEGSFRKDLYYRICGTQINLVPLRDRREDIPFLVRYFLGEKAPLVLPEAMEILLQQEWPGNVRELKMVLETLKGTKTRKAIGKEVVYKILEAHSHAGATETQMLTYSQFKKQISKENEAGYFRSLLRKAKGNISKVAMLAGIHRRQVYEKMKTLGIKH